MKYLKKFKKFETIGYTEMTDELWNDMSDILLDLSDQGFLVTKDVDDIKRVDNKLCEDVIEIIIDNNQNFVLLQTNKDFIPYFCQLIFYDKFLDKYSLHQYLLEELNDDNIDLIPHLTTTK